MTQKEYFRKRYLEEDRPAYEAFVKFYPFTLDDLDGEIWKVIAGYEDYQVSNLGRVKSFKRYPEGKIMTPCLNNQGYLRVKLYKNGQAKLVSVHQLVALAFIPNPDNKPQVDHVYGMKFDNSVWNLRWATSLENKKYAYETGAYKSGADRSDAKLTNEQVQYIRNNPDGLTHNQFAAKFGVNQSIISHIQLGKTYKNAGGNIRTEHGSRKLNEAQRNEIRTLYVRGSNEFGSRALAKKFDVNQKTILNIIKEKNV